MEDVDKLEVLVVDLDKFGSPVCGEQVVICSGGSVGGVGASVGAVDLENGSASVHRRGSVVDSQDGGVGVADDAHDGALESHDNEARRLGGVGQDEGAVVWIPNDASGARNFLSAVMAVKE